jgi:hypothetical protein
MKGPFEMPPERGRRNDDASHPMGSLESLISSRISSFEWKMWEEEVRDFSEA